MVMALVCCLTHCRYCNSLLSNRGCLVADLHLCSAIADWVHDHLQLLCLVSCAPQGRFVMGADAAAAILL
jgi:hypothetical protein